MGIEIIPTAAPVGAEIRGVDLDQTLADADFEAVENAFNDHGVIFFREQPLSPEGLLAFTQRFGNIAFNVFGEDHGLADHPGVVVISNVEERGREIGVKAAGSRWHSDMCYTAKPPRGTILCAREVPDQDGLVLGDTCFAATHAAYDDLPDAMKRQIDGRKSVFDFAGRKRAQVITQEQRDRFPAVTHPLVRTHPHTGRKCLYVMRDDCTGIVGMEEGEAQRLIAALADHIIRPEYVYRHRWQAGDVLMWDNCTVQHMAIQDYELPQRRLMHRTTFAADTPPA
ncbi:MAG: TauD/TfdA family dioxygenase [Alphaproteobacteria bacterium]|nr:TauD/TfdA family dioxygenase [Alphaproteobacteria bacterium]